MPRSDGLLSSFKSFFKGPKSTGDGTRVAPQRVPDSNDVSSRASQGAAVPVSDLASNDMVKSVAPAGLGNEMLRLPFGSRKALHRKLLAHTSGPLAASTFIPANVAQAELYHSISDPCENVGIKSTSCAANSKGCERYVEQACGPNASQLRDSSARVVSARTAFNPAARSDTVLLSSCDISSRCSSLDIQGAATMSGPVEVTIKPRPSIAAPLSSVERRTCTRQPGAQVPSKPGPFGAPAVEAEPPPADTMLLALCPGAPAAMRRKKWCLEDYEVSRKIYKGSTSAVYKATCRRSGLPVALKVYFLAKVPSNVIHMIVREIKIHVELVHKNIVMLYGAFQDEKRLVLVQEYATRGDLYGIYRSMDRRMSEAQLTTLVLAPFMDALAYLHARGICHRDVKPENILFTNDWRLVIADFGVSINLHQERAVTRAGTLEYMAPEVERCPLKMLPEENKDNDSIAYGTAVDVWATGVLAYELMVGFPPFVVDHSAGAGSNGISGAGGAFLAEHATRKTLSFPSSTTPGARDFISLALAERPEERPTALQLCRHPWLAAAPSVGPECAAAVTHQQQSRSASSHLGGVSVSQLHPSRLGSAALASGPCSSVPPA